MGFFTDLITNAINEYSENKDMEDTLKTLVFAVGHNSAIDREIKKLIANMMQILDENFSLFNNEGQIDAVYRKIQNVNITEFFDDILSLRVDRTKIANIYVLDLTFILFLMRMGLLHPQYIYNLYLIRKHFNLTRQELATCYRTIANMQNQKMDFDDVAEEIEDLVGDAVIQELIQQYPYLIEKKI